MCKLRYQFGLQLRRLRVERNMTQEALAEALDVTPEFISNIERGINAPSFNTLEKLETVLSVPISEMFAQIATNGDEASSHRHVGQQFLQS